MYIEPIVLDPVDGVAKPWSEAFSADPWAQYVNQASRHVPVIGSKPSPEKTCQD